MAPKNYQFIDQKLSDADAFLTFFDKGFRHANERSFIWRGMHDEKYYLIPSALRPENRDKISKFVLLESPGIYDAEGESIKKEDNFYADAMAFEERHAVKHFYRRANGSGLALPPLSQMQHEALLEVGGSQFALESSWPPDWLLPIIGLAQHSGIPTRLLDWTSSPYIATYFAAASKLAEISEYKDLEGELVVWGIRTNFLSALNKALKDGSISAAVRIVDAQYGFNRNLSAQRGRFTLLQATNLAEVRFDTPLDKATAHLASLVPEVNSGEFPFDILKLRIDARSCPDLLLFLQSRGIDGASLFPGLEGCVRAAQDEHKARMFNRQRSGY